MSNNLREALDSAKKNRGVLSKLIIWESQISKTQFYRIISGQEAPSEETKTRIATSLGIDNAEFDRLFHLSASPSQQITSPSKSWGKRFFPVIVLPLIAVGLISAMAIRNQTPDEPPLSETIADPQDGTLFIKDVTIPDGSSIPVNTTFVKTWRVKNTGSLVWKNRYLKRVTPQSTLLCSSPNMVPIPETAPGEIVDISVTFTAPHLPGSCRTDWKSADDRGQLHFPDKHGLFSIVTIVERNP